jgi:hypothetical protein
MGPVGRIEIMTLASESKAAEVQQLSLVVRAIDSVRRFFDGDVFYRNICWAPMSKVGMCYRQLCSVRKFR